MKNKSSKAAPDISEHKKENEQEYFAVLARIHCVQYFQSDNSNVQLFRKSNKAVLYLLRRELSALNKERLHNGNSKLVSAYRSRDIIRLYQIRELDQGELKKLFADKFAEAKALYGYKTHEIFAARELTNMENDVNIKVEGQRLKYAFAQWRELLQKISEGKVKISKTSERAQPVIIGAFILLARDSRAVPEKDGETNIPYAKRICKEYHLPYTDKVRQGLSGSTNSKQRKKVVENILPNLPNQVSQKIIAYINKKYGKVELYA